jgi:dTDP-4-amino-4,6-dideoxygalactose transaminase
MNSIAKAAPALNSVPMLDINRGNRELHDEIMTAIAKVVESGRFLHGPEVSELERQVAELSQTKHAIGCASGSDALLLALMALDIGPGDEVILPSFTFFATASCVSRVGAKIVFADIDPKTFNLSPASVASVMTSRTRAIIPVHLFGQCASMDAIQEVADRQRLPIIEDAAQAIGAAYHGRMAGSWGTVGCLSFYPTKNLGGMGDGGMIVCHDDALAERLRLFAAHGMQPRYHHRVIGINSRLDTLQAAILNVKLNRLASYIHARQKHAQKYSQMLQASGLTEEIQLPVAQPNSFHVWNQYGIRVPDGGRDALKAHLQSNGIGCEIYYPIPLHLQECYRSLGYSLGSLPETERAAREVLHLPVYPELTADEQVRVVDSIGRFFGISQQRKAA